jgi:hypothetical protein
MSGTYLNLYSLNNNKAYADGVTISNLACSGIEDLKEAFCVGILPIILKGGAAKNFSIRLELYDHVNHGVFPNATYEISIVKTELDPNIKDKTFLSGIFKTRNGFFTIYIHSSEKEGPRFSKSEHPMTKFYSSNRGDSMNLTLPYDLVSGQYRVQTMVDVGKRGPLYFESDLHIGEIESKNLLLNKIANNITAISYYNEITDLNFDANNRTISWKTPFEYNASKIEAGKGSVHEEIIIPNSFLELMRTKNFTMAINDNYSDSSLFRIDPYSFKNQTVIHYALGINTLFNIATRHSGPNHQFLKFALTV